MKQKRDHYTDEKFKDYREALQWVFTDHKIETMPIKQGIHNAMKLVKRHYDWSTEQVFNFIMGQFVSSNGHLWHNKEKYKHITIMLHQAESSLIGLLKGIVRESEK